MVADGAMGTALLAKGNFANRSLDELNRSLPALVRNVHQEYLRAGAQILRANTFGANRKRLEAFGFGDKVWHINQAGVRIAREAGRDQAFVAGSVGPLGAALQPLGAISPEEARAIFRQQIEALLEAGVDLLVLETFRDLNELREAVCAAREAAGEEMVIAAHVSVDDDGSLADGSSLEDFARALDQSPADLIGVNCSTGPASVLHAIEQMTAFTRKPLSAVPSAGVGSVCTPDYMARYANRFLRAGAKMVGGCCGTTPDHIRAIRSEVREFVPSDTDPIVHPEESTARPSRLELEPLARRSELGAKLAARQFVALAEIQATRGPDAAREVAAARRLKAAGIDAVIVVSRPGMQSATAACFLIKHSGTEPVLELPAGLSAMQIQSELMGAFALGIHNVVVSSVAAAHIANNLNQGLDRGGHPVGSQTSLTVGARLTRDSDAEALAQAGADFVIAPPSFELEQLDPSRVPRIIGIRPLTGFRDAEYLINEKQVAIPPATVARMSLAQSGEAARKEGIEIARETVQQVRGQAAGVCLSSADDDLAIAVTQVIGAAE
jgi:homocysteine S-methyltransferase